LIDATHGGLAPIVQRISVLEESAGNDAMLNFRQ